MGAKLVGRSATMTIGDNEPIAVEIVGDIVISNVTEKDVRPLLMEPVVIRGEIPFSDDKVPFYRLLKDVLGAAKVRQIMAENYRRRMTAAREEFFDALARITKKV